MTSLQFAKRECANFEHDGSCKGIGIKDDGSLYSFGKKPACVLGRRIPCPYFEECVLPMGIETGTASGMVRARDRDQARHEYARFSPTFSKQKGRRCQVCKRREVEKHKRFCYVCAAARKQRSDRAGGAERQKRSRLSRKTTSRTPDNIGSNEGVPPETMSP